MNISRLAFTTGEPAGIGVDLAIILAQTELDYELVCFSNHQLLLQRAKILNLPLTVIDFDFDNSATTNKKQQIKLIDFALGAEVTAQELNPKNSQFVLSTIKTATEYCLQQKFAALITAPVNKGVINQAGIEFSGHTELLRDYCQVEQVVMMLLNNHMKVALATTHLPLSEIASKITKTALIKIITVLQQDLRKKFSIAKPTILVAGLNPHAGEYGYLGSEEIDEIIPALEFCRQNFNVNLIGPLPADTMFNAELLTTADAILAMYHDQGLPVLKYSGFGSSVNITLGLPFVRTSVDHGTALELAGTGNISLGSLRTAIKTALKMGCKNN